MTHFSFRDLCYLFLTKEIYLISGNIRVFCRCRPFKKQELSAGSATIVDLDGAKDGDLGILTGGSTRKNFKFDRVYTPTDDQGARILQLIGGYSHAIFTL